MLVFLFNVGGYYIVFYALHYQADRETWSRLDNGHYSEAETSIIKIPMALPYPTHEGVYQNIQDNFEYDGVYYKGIKQKLENDTLLIVCVKDQREKHIDSVLKHYENVSNNTSSKQSQSLLSKVLKEYETFSQPTIVQQTGWILTFLYSQLPSTLLTATQSVQSPPPWQLS